MRRLPAADRERLRVDALSLARMERRHRVVLPAPLVHACLAQCPTS